MIRTTKNHIKRRLRKSKLRKQSKQPVAKIKRECKAIVDRIVSIRDNDICQKCEQRVYGSNRHRSHVIPVSAGNKLRFDPMNIKILCYHDHLGWWHKNPTEAAEWFKEKFPERDAYIKANKGIAVMKYFDFVELKEKLSQQLQELL